LFPPFGYRVAVPASCGAPWGGACTLRPLPLLCRAVSAAGSARRRSPFDKILPKTAHSSQGSSHTILSKISLAVSPPSAHVRRGRRVLKVPSTQSTKGVACEKYPEKTGAAGHPGVGVA